jgi:transposase
VINVGMLAKIRRMHLRDRMSLREVSRRTGLSRNTVRSWLRRGTGLKEGESETQTSLL